MADKVHIPQEAAGPTSEPYSGIPVYLAQCRHLTPPGLMPAYR